MPQLETPAHRSGHAAKRVQVDVADQNVLPRLAHGDERVHAGTRVGRIAAMMGGGVAAAFYGDVTVLRFHGHCGGIDS